METAQIYAIVNDINRQTMGEEAIQAVDTASFIAMGSQILTSSDNTECFLNTLVQRIARTIIQTRSYKSKMSELAFTDVEWGAIMQKIKVEMPEAVEDVSVNLVDGESVDQWIVAKPKAKKKFFVIRSPYDFFITIQRRWLKEAFLNPAEMEAFIGAVFNECNNKLELSQENLGRMSLANFIANVDEQQTVKLLTKYNAVTGETAPSPQAALYNEKFMRFAVGEMKMASIRLQEMSTLYNKEGYKRFTSLSDQFVVTRADFKVGMETQVDYAAFHDNYLKVATDLEVAYWQNAQTPNKIIIGEGNNTTTVNNVLALIHDRDALGTFRKETEVLTTPINARGAYYNTFYHTNDARFNDMSENGILFLLA